MNVFSLGYDFPMERSNSSVSCFLTNHYFCTTSQNHLIHIQSSPLISYEGTNATELVSDFHNAVDDYLALCESDGTKPEVAFKGSLNVRFKNSDIHRQATIYAFNHDQSLNSFIEEAVMEKLARC